MDAQHSVTLLQGTTNLKKGQVQHLAFQAGEVPFYAMDDDEHIGKVKGLKKIPFERGLLVPGMTKTEAKCGGKPDPKLSMVMVLGAQPDFVTVEHSLVLLVRHCGGFAMMLPNFHFEINPIELAWGRSKHWARVPYSLLAGKHLQELRDGIRPFKLKHSGKVLQEGGRLQPGLRPEAYWARSSHQEGNVQVAPQAGAVGLHYPQLMDQRLRLRARYDTIFLYEYDLYVS